MSEEKIGGISLDDIMVAAMGDLDDEIPVAETTEVINSESFLSTEQNHGEHTQETVATESTGNQGIGSFTPEKRDIIDSAMNADNLVPDKTVSESIPAFKSDFNLKSESNNDGTPKFVSDTTKNDSLKVSVNTDDSTNGIGIEKKDVYSIAGFDFVNVKNRFSGVYEQMVNEVSSLLEASRTAEALQLSKQLVDNNMSNEVAWLFYGYANGDWGDTGMAKKAFEQSMAINPAFPDPYASLGFLYQKEEQYNNAYDCYSKALELDPKNVTYMGDVAEILAYTDSYGAAIDKCKYFIDVSEDKTYLQNVLGRILVEFSKEYVVDVPDDYEDPNSETTPGFISLEDIKAVRKNCNEAKSLLTLDSFKEDAEMAELLLQACDEDCKIESAYRKRYVVFQTFLTGLFYFIICIFTVFIPLPLMILAIYGTIQGFKFPRYMINYSWYTGTGDPMKYVSDSFYKNHQMLKSMAEGAKEARDAVKSEESWWWSILKEHGYAIKCRFHFYKRFLKQRKEQKENSIGSIKTDDMDVK